MHESAPNDAVAIAQEMAAQGGLRYVSDTRPGFTRRKKGKTFAYFDQKNTPITDEKQIERINKIGIPPAYERVWICPYTNGHLQATGYDAKGRKQYRYHTRWREVRDENKFHHILKFGDTLPAIRKQVEKHLQLKGLPREKVLATVITLLEKTLIRVGNAEYAKKNNSYGLTTMRRKHVSIEGTKISFEFTGKSGKKWQVSVKDRRISAIVKRCADIPGYELFKYVAEDGTYKDVESADVNAYLKEITGENFTAKDYRTWAGTVLASIALTEFEKYDSEAQAKKNVVSAINHVAQQLGNTPAICRKCYIHPEIINAYITGELAKNINHEIDDTIKEEYASLMDEEIMVLAFLKNRLSPLAKKPAASISKG